MGKLNKEMVEEIIISLSVIRMKKCDEKESRRSVRRAKARQTFGKFEEVALSHFDSGAEVVKCQSRRLSEQGDINGRCFEDYTCECDSGFELKSTARDSEVCHACENEQDCLGGRHVFQ